MNLSSAEPDVSREGFTMVKVLHAVRTYCSYRADQIVDRVMNFAEIDFPRLRISGIRGIILDVDECIAPHHGNILIENLEKIRELISQGFRIAVFSNMEYTDRYAELEAMGVVVVRSPYPKPDVRGFQECLRVLGLYM